MQTYTSILTLDFHHDYFVDGKCRDVWVSPCPKTQQIIKGHRLRVRYHPSGLAVFAPLNSLGELLIPLVPDIRFRWLLKPRSQVFKAITHLPTIRPRVPFLYSNQKDDSNLKLPTDVLAPTPAQFFADYGGLTEDGVDVPESMGLAYITTEVELEDSIPLQLIPMDDGYMSAPLPAKASIEDFHFGTTPRDQWALLPGRILTFDHAPAAQHTTTTIDYPTKVDAERDTLAVVDLWLKAAIRLDTDPALTYQLLWKQSLHHWHYLIAVDSSFVPSGSNLRLMQTLGSGSPSEISIEVWELGPTNPEDLLPSGATIGTLVQQTWANLQPRLKTGDKAFFLRTQSALPYHENCSLQLQLKKGSNWESPGDTVSEAEADEFYFLPPPDPLQHGFSSVLYPPKS